MTSVGNESQKVCACCGQVVAAAPVRPAPLMVDDQLLQLCNQAFSEAERTRSAEVEVAHLVVSIASFLDEAEAGRWLGASRSVVAGEARRWISERSTDATAVLRTSAELKVLLARAQDACRQNGRTYASVWDVLNVMRTSSSGLPSARLLLFPAVQASRASSVSSRPDATPNPRRAAVFDGRNPAANGWTAKTAPEAAPSRQQASAETNLSQIDADYRGARAQTAMRAYDLSRDPFDTGAKSAADGHGYGTFAQYTSGTAASIARDPRDAAIEALTKQLEAHEGLLAQLLASADAPVWARDQRRATAAQVGSKRVEEARTVIIGPSAAATESDGRISGISASSGRWSRRLRRRRRWQMRRSLRGSATENAPRELRPLSAVETIGSAGAPAAAAEAEAAADFDELAEPIEPADEDERADAGGDRPKRFYLAIDDPVVQAPSIGNRTAARLEAAGIFTVRDLLSAQAQVASARINARFITAQRFADWQAQARLVCTVPWLRGTHAQLLVGAGHRSVDEIVSADVSELCAAILKFAGTREGQSVLRSGPPPDIERVGKWIEHSRLAEVGRAA